MFADDFNQTILERPSIKRFINELSDDTLVVPNINRAYKRATASTNICIEGIVNQDVMNADINVEIPKGNDICGRVYFHLGYLNLEDFRVARKQIQVFPLIILEALPIPNAKQLDAKNSVKQQLTIPSIHDIFSGASSKGIAKKSCNEIFKTKVY